MITFEIAIAIYGIGAALTAQPIGKMTAKEWEEKMLAGKIPPGTEIIGLLVSQFVSILLWPLTGLLWVVGSATRRLKRQP